MDHTKDLEHASRYFPAWEVGELPAPPARRWATLIGPGALMAGSAIGGGEWLLGPAVTAQYGGTLMWLATISIVLQVFYNLEVMRYTLYCGEPIMIGFFRSAPGPRFWLGCYLLLDFMALWPYLAANAAVPLLAAFLGRLPGPEDESLRTSLSFAVFLAAFVPLIFGGKIYTAIERVMVTKLVLVLGYLLFIAVFLARPATSGEIWLGFLRLGEVPLKAQQYAGEGSFVLELEDDGILYTVKGTMHTREGTPYAEVRDSRGAAGAGERGREIGQRAIEEARALMAGERFYFRLAEGQTTIEVRGQVEESGRRWRPRSARVSRGGIGEDQAIEDIPGDLRMRVEALCEGKGQIAVNVAAYLWQEGRLPTLDWAMLAAFAAIAGVGGLSNTQFSNYSREKGWGMGGLVGAIPSAVGGKTIALSHVGKRFPVTPQSRQRWRDWMRFIRQDQVFVWMIGCFFGVALPAVLSLEYLRNVPVSGDRTAAMSAAGIAGRAGEIFWFLTLFCGFLVLAPSQVATIDGLIRRWTDLSWTGLPALRRLEGYKVKYIYYSLLCLYAIWGLVVLWFLPKPGVLVNVTAGVLMNMALGFSALHTLWVNRRLLPRELRPGLGRQAGLVACGGFFLSLSAVALHQGWSQLAAALGI